MIKTPEIYDIWNEEKKKIQFSKKKRGKRVIRGEIWIAKIGVNIGSELSKDVNFSRPVLVLRDHMGGDLVLIIPMTGEQSPINQNFSELLVEWKTYGLDKPSYLLYNQIKSISSSRLTRKLNNYFYKNQKYIPILPENIL